METKSNYTFIGLAVLTLIVGLISSALWLSVGFDRKTYDTYLIYMDEPVSGLNEESPVKYSGVKVGFISDIQLSPSNPTRVNIIVKIEHDVLITTSTEASLVAQGITGNTFLGLNATTSTRKRLKKKPNDPYPVIPYKPSFYFQLENKINRLFDEDNINNMRLIIKNLEEIAQTFKKNDPNIDQSLRELPRLINALETSASRFNSMATNVSVAGIQFTQTMKLGKHTINQLAQQTIPNMIILLRRLDHIASNLEVVSNQLRQNPAIIIRGTAPPKPGPGE